MLRSAKRSSQFLLSISIILKLRIRSKAVSYTHLDVYKRQAMYYSGINPETGKKVFVARNPHDKAMQRALMQYKNPKNRQLVLSLIHI